MKYIKKEIADKMSAVDLCKRLLSSFELLYTPYMDNERERQIENDMRLELMECLKEKILSGDA